jgi:cytochrome c553
MSARAPFARRWAIGLGMLSALVALQANAASADAARIVAEGNGAGAAPCRSCHGADGGGQAAAGFPRLAGLDEHYLARQLDGFADGSRASPVMQPVAGALSPQEREALAAFYSRLAAPKTPARPAATAQQDELGQQLATRGRWSEGIPPCERCHGPGGVGVGSGFPPLAGQPGVYLANQLRAWRAGARRNDPLQLMQTVSKALDEKDIDAVAAWFAAEPLDHEESHR